jgi:hypothetical protein
MPKDLSPQPLKILNYKLSGTNKKNWKNHVLTKQQLYNNGTLLEASPRKTYIFGPFKMEFEIIQFTLQQKC